MGMFLLGYLAAVATYVAIGLGVGGYIVATNLARFFAAGWRWKMMEKTLAIAALCWPMVAFEHVEQQ